MNYDREREKYLQLELMLRVVDFLHKDGCYIEFLGHYTLQTFNTHLHNDFTFRRQQNVVTEQCGVIHVDFSKRLIECSGYASHFEEGIKQVLILFEEELET